MGIVSIIGKCRGQQRIRIELLLADQTQPVIISAAQRCKENYHRVQCIHSKTCGKPLGFRSSIIYQMMPAGVNFMIRLLSPS